MLAIGAWTVRGLAWWPFAAASCVAGRAPARARASLRAAAARWRDPSLVAASSPFVFVLAIVARCPGGGRGSAHRPRAGSSTPRRGSPWPSRAHGQARRPVFTPQTWASWFEWAAPVAHYFLDSRFELFPAPVWDDYALIERGGPEAQAALDRWGVHIVIWPAGPRRPRGG